MTPKWPLNRENDDKPLENDDNYGYYGLLFYGIGTYVLLTHLNRQYTARELVKNPKVWGPGPLKFLFVNQYRDMSTKIGRGPLRFLEHSYLCRTYT